MSEIRRLPVPGGYYYDQQESRFVQILTFGALPSKELVVVFFDKDDNSRHALMWPDFTEDRFIFRGLFV
jgi:hypothetical protein